KIGRFIARPLFSRGSDMVVSAPSSALADENAVEAQRSGGTLPRREAAPSPDARGRIIHATKGPLLFWFLAVGGMSEPPRSMCKLPVDVKSFFTVFRSNSEAAKRIATRWRSPAFTLRRFACRWPTLGVSDRVPSRSRLAVPGPPVEGLMRSCRILLAVIALLLVPSLANTRGGGGGHGGGGHSGGHSASSPHSRGPSDVHSHSDSMPRGIAPSSSPP